jgi:hypothetical protein
MPLLTRKGSIKRGEGLHPKGAPFSKKEKKTTELVNEPGLYALSGLFTIRKYIDK